MLSLSQRWRLCFTKHDLCQYVRSHCLSTCLNLCHQLNALVPVIRQMVWCKIRVDLAHESRVHNLFTLLWYCTLYGYTIVFRCYQLACQVKMHANPNTIVFMWMLTPTTTSISICQYGINYHLDWSWIPSKLTHSAFPWWSYFLITANTQERQDAVMMLFKFWTWRWKFIF